MHIYFGKTNIQRPRWTLFHYIYNPASTTLGPKAEVLGDPHLTLLIKPSLTLSHRAGLILAPQNSA